jgi:MFS family permease
MVAAALRAINKEFNITSSIVSSLTLSIFVLASAIGPLFLGPLSEIYGRVIVLQTSNILYLFFNLGCGLALLWGARARVTSASASLDAVSSMERSRNFRRALLVGIAVDLIDLCSCVVGVLDENKNRRAVGWLCGGAVYLYLP